MSSVLSPDPFTVALAERVPALQLDALKAVSKKYPRDRQRVLSEYVLDALQGRRAHAQVVGAITLSWEDLRRDLHAPSLDLVDTLLSPLFDRDQSNHVGHGLTRAYTLRPEIRDHAVRALWGCIHDPIVQPATITVPAHDTLGMPSYLCDVPAVLTELTEAHVHEAHRQIPEADIEGRAWLARVRTAIARHGGLPNAFGLQSSGRLDPKTPETHIVRMPQRVRSSLLGQLGWVDVDIRSCHLSAFLSLSTAWDFGSDLLRRYRDRKDAVHREWAAQIGHDPPDDFKDLVLSFLNGGSLTAVLPRIIGKRLGDKAAAWVALPDVAALYEEIRRGRRHIIARSHFDGLPLSNAAGFTRRDLTKRNVLSHILTGFEQLAMNTMLPLLPEHTLRSVIFDGWVSTDPLAPVDLQHLTDAVRDESTRAHGVALDIALKVSPFAIRDDADF